MRIKTRAAGASVLLAIGALLAATVLLAGPAGADEHDTSVGVNAADDSVSSGAGIAIDGSVASGDAVAVDGSVSSGCASAIDDSTASGGSCKKEHDDDKDKDKHHHKADHHAAPVAKAVGARNLAFTGSSTAPLALAAAAFTLLGAALVLGSRRGQQAQS